jgi:ubiquinone/menaquinone biosynthesis C-methylase UbiE
MKDNFSNQSSLYVQYRPTYPAELFEYILRFVNNKTTAWDCATGNGQAAIVLSKSFKKVIATDISHKQIANAEKADNIYYSVQPAEHTNIESSTVNLITVAQALHWFHFENFYAEVKRVAAENAFMAAWAYSLLQIDEHIDALIRDYHFNTLGKFWDAERKHVDDEYRNIPFPFEKLDVPQFHIEQYWSIEDLQGYLNTWSALQHCISEKSENPIPGLIELIRPSWGTVTKRRIIFPVHLLLGAIK